MFVYLFESTQDLCFKDLIQYPNIQVEENKFCFLSGKSGTGKSTYLKMLNRTLLCDTGKIFYKGKDIYTYPVLEYRKEVLLVPQEVYLFEGTVQDNFEIYYSSCHKELCSKEEMFFYLKLCCIDIPLESNCATLSGGERQRVFLAIFLSCHPHVLLLDEPTAALDQETSVQLFRNIKAYCKKEKISVLCVCHSNILIEQFADCIIRIGEMACTQL